ncbi:MAG: saccharopine dehydrogenase NADP-binding domain-containing protein [Methylotenera sp.]|nr:saccharopine dehydrogenase NADP-binding domain-containing protein [Oligoflexia bacterium]
MKHNWMIYGANGYTGKLIAEEAARRKLTPILAGRSAAVTELSQRLKLESRLFSLDEESPQIAAHLNGIDLVLHCAGPFSRTCRPMLDACLLTGTHYLDITGEIDVFEAIHARSVEIARAGITALPGVGFDVVPTDCLAAGLKKKLPDATHLSMAFRSAGKFSPGTAKSMLEGLARGCKVRREGRIETVPFGLKSRQIAFEGSLSSSQNAILAPWGDVSTAFHSTGIPNIEFFIANPNFVATGMRIASAVAKLRPFHKLAESWINRNISGPDETTRQLGNSWIWGEAGNLTGQTVTSRIQVAAGYPFTVLSALECVRRIRLKAPTPGATTPSLAFGAEFVFDIPGTHEFQS